MDVLYFLEGFGVKVETLTDPRYQCRTMAKDKTSMYYIELMKRSLSDDFEKEFNKKCLNLQSVFRHLQKDYIYDMVLEQYGVYSVYDKTTRRISNMSVFLTRHKLGTYIIECGIPDSKEFIYYLYRDGVVYTTNINFDKLATHVFSSIYNVYTLKDETIPDELITDKEFSDEVFAVEKIRVKMVPDSVSESLKEDKLMVHYPFTEKFDDDATVDDLKRSRLQYCKIQSIIRYTEQNNLRDMNTVVNFAYFPFMIK